MPFEVIVGCRLVALLKLSIFFGIKVCMIDTGLDGTEHS